MQVAVLSDIHANLPALEAVLVQVRMLGIRRILCLGDMVGYYYWPALCLERLSAFDVIDVRGNHEVMLAEAMECSATLHETSKNYGHGIEIALQELTAGEIKRLAELPLTCRVDIFGRTACLCHGTADGSFDYIYPDASAQDRERMHVPHVDVVFYGHTHHPVIWKSGGLSIANPGSVGQPRNYQPGAHWLLWDLESNTLTHRCSDYDVGLVVKECQTRDPDLPYLTNVLLRQRRE